MNASSELFCFRCGAPNVFKERIGRADTCSKCDADLHCCRNCRHYSPSAHNQCNEPQAEWVREKDRGNFCDYFEPRRGTAGGVEKNRERDARARFEDLFKK
jgi:hypothetical protein